MANVERRLSNNISPSSVRLRTLLSPISSTFSSNPPSLRKALHLLHLRDLDSLENHFIALSAFLKPWCHFRDTFFLVQPSHSPRASDPSVIHKQDVLRFYTNFLHGELRYDARADDNASQFTNDETKYGTFDKSHWEVQDYEKMMYAWMMQEFHIGKVRNPYGFKYFECKNVCTAWEEVLKPIVVAVRESYDVRGRQYYGRLALFIESRNPSRLAFPEGNVLEPALKGATPFRMLSYTKGQVHTDSPVIVNTLADNVLPRHHQLTDKDYAQVDVELRDVVEKHGGLVERPKFKARMEDWLAVQRERARQKKRLQDHRRGRKASGLSSPIFGCKGIDVASGEIPPMEDLRRSMAGTFVSTDSGGRSPVSPSLQFPRVSQISGSSVTSGMEKKTREAKVPYGMYGFKMAPRSEPVTPKTPDHGSPRRIELPDISPSNESKKNTVVSSNQDEKVGIEEDQPWTKPVPRYEKPTMQRQSSDGVYTSIRNFNSFAGRAPPKLASTLEQEEDPPGGYMLMSPMDGGPPSAIPKPLFNSSAPHMARDSAFMDSLTTFHRDQGAESIVPSHIGNGYEREITPGFVADKLHAAPLHNPYKAHNMYVQPLSIPAPVRQFSQERRSISELRRTCNAAHPPQHVPWPGAKSPDASDSCLIEYSSSSDETSPTPPIPPKNPRRVNSVHRSNSSSCEVVGANLPPVQPSSNLGPRIISKDNIRAHLSLSTDSSRESLARVDEEEGTFAGPVKEESSPMQPFPTYNTHMFPRKNRKGTPMDG